MTFKETTKPYNNRHSQVISKCCFKVNQKKLKFRADQGLNRGSIEQNGLKPYSRIRIYV